MNTKQRRQEEGSRGSLAGGRMPVILVLSWVASVRAAWASLINFIMIIIVVLVFIVVIITVVVTRSHLADAGLEHLIIFYFLSIGIVLKAGAPDNFKQQRIAQVMLEGWEDQQASSTPKRGPSSWMLFHVWEE